MVRCLHFHASALGHGNLGPSGAGTYIKDAKRNSAQKALHRRRPFFAAMRPSDVESVAEVTVERSRGTNEIANFELLIRPSLYFTHDPFSAGTGHYQLANGLGGAPVATRDGPELVPRANAEA